jgi:hypothetical protein
MATGVSATPFRCTECGTELSGNYCQSCGMKKLDHHSLALRHFLPHALHELLHLDSKIFRTLGVLVFRPGKLTTAFLEGKRQRYVSPVRLYLVLFAIALFIYSTFHHAYDATTLSLSIDIQSLAKNDRTGGIGKGLDEISRRKGINRESVEERFNERWHAYTSFAQLLEVIVFALVLAILYWNRKRYMVEHLIFSLHVLSFTYLMGILCSPLLAALGKQRILFLATVFIEIFYLFLALRQVYAGRAVWAVMRALVLYVGLWVTRLAIVTLLLAIIMILFLR